MRAAIAVVILLAIGAGWARADDRPRSTLTRQVRNAEACLPSLGDPPDDMVRFADGRYSSPTIPFAEMRAIGSGKIRDRTMAAVEIVWNTGGSGNWEIVALFRQDGDELVYQGGYSPAGNLPDGGTMVERIEIRSGRIHLYGADPVHHRTIAKPLIVATSAFERCRLKGPG